MHISYLAWSALLAVVSSQTSAVSPQILGLLQNSLSGKVHIGRPYDGPCYTTYSLDNSSAYNAAQCAEIKATLTQAEVLIQSFGSYLSPSFGACMANGQKCTLSPDVDVNETTPQGTCYQGSVPPVYVDAQSAADVETALKIAYQHSIPLTIKNTGHDYRGYSAAPNTLGIWTHHIQPIPVLTNNFIPDGGKAAGPAVTYGAGQSFDGLYAFLATSNHTMVGGTCGTVGAAGGYLAGGGYGVLSQQHGLAVDNALQIRAVLPNGTSITANRYQNTDLFFALRGGGGGTFGVVTEVTSTIIPDSKPVAIGVLAVTVPDPRPATEIFVENAVAWANAGITGSIGVREGNSASVIAISFSLNPVQLEAALQPVITYFQSVANATNPFVPLFLTTPNYYSFQESPISVEFAARGIGNTTITASRLVPKSQFETAQGQEALVDVLVQYEYGAMLTPPSNYTLPQSDLVGGPGQASVTPAWRDAIWHVVHETVYDPADPALTTPAAEANIFSTLSKSVDPLRSLLPNSGAYMNEGDTYEPNAPQSFWGYDNYDRLLSIKKQLDPNNLMSCLKCVGGNESDPRNKCYPNIGR